MKVSGKTQAAAIYQTQPILSKFQVCLRCLDCFVHAEILSITHRLLDYIPEPIYFRSCQKIKVLFKVYSVEWRRSFFKTNTSGGTYRQAVLYKQTVTPFSLVG